MLIISAPHCDITSSCDDSNVANIHFFTYNLMEAVEAKLEVKVAKSVDTTFSQETGDRFVSPVPLFKPTILAKSLGTKTPQIRASPLHPQCNVDLKGSSQPESLQALSTLLGVGGGRAVTKTV